jgi:hypothetical protein
MFLRTSPLPVLEDGWSVSLVKAYHVLFDSAVAPATVIGHHSARQFTVHSSND